MEQATRAEVESIDSNLDQNTFGKLVQTNYNYIMAEINQKDVDYNEPNSRGDGNQSFYHDNPAAVDSSLFVLDCVGNKTLKDSLGQNNNGSMSISNEVGSYDDDAAITNDNLELLNKSHLNSNDDDDQQDESEEIKTETKEEGRVISNRQRKRLLYRSTFTPKISPHEFVPSKEYIENVLLYEFHKGCDPSTAAKTIRFLYGNDILDKRSCKRMFARFRGYNNEPTYKNKRRRRRKGQPKILDSDQLQALVAANPNLPSRDLARVLDVEPDVVERHLKRIGNIPVAGKCVTQELSPGTQDC